MTRPVVLILAGVLALAAVCEAADDTPNEVKAFLKAVQKNDLATVRTALAGNPKLVHAATRSSWPALHEAAEEGHLEMVTLLIAKGADVNQLDSGGHSALHRTAREGHKEIVVLLMAKGADVNLRSSMGEMPLDMADRKKRVEVAEILIAHGAWSGKRFGKAIERDDVKTVAATLDAHPNLVTEGGYRGLGKIPLTKTSPLFLASYKGSLKVMKLLIARGANVNRRSQAYSHMKHNGAWTPLHLAAVGGHKEAVEYLLKKGADIDARGSRGQTPLYVALNQGGRDVAKLLIDKGAELNVKDLNPYSDRTALQLAIQGYPDLAKTMIEKGANIELRGRHQMTPLHIAVTRRETELVKMLLKKGADINARARYGMTALDLAWGSRRRNRVIADILIKHGGKHGRHLGGR